MVRLPSFDPIQYLVARRFLSELTYATWPYDDVASQATFRKRQPEIKAYVAELRKKTPNEIQSLVETERKKENQLIAQRQAIEDKSRFFNQPESAADFDHWSRTAYWTLEEGVALIFGKDPHKVNWPTIQGFAQKSPFVKQYAKTLELVKRAAAVKTLANTNLPGFFLAWAKRNDMDPPEELIRLVEKYGGQIADWPELLRLANERTEEAWETGKKYQAQAYETAHKSVADALEAGKKAHSNALTAWAAERDNWAEKVRQLKAEIEELKSSPPKVEPQRAVDLGGRERESLLKLVIGMAIGGYGLDPKASRTPVTAHIATDLATNGVSLDEDTVRKYLQEGKQLLPPETE